jgi:apolipoprotein D and lipocalin family protein
MNTSSAPSRPNSLKALRERFLPPSDFASKSVSLPKAFFVDLDQYMGDWYVMAAIPTPFETKATNAVESYTWNASENRIDVQYHHNEGRPDGPVRRYSQKAWIVDRNSNAEWKVQLFWPLKFSYRILEIASDYSWSLVGTESKNFVWIFCRRPHMDDELLSSLKQKLSSWGYDLSKLRKVPQIWDTVS